MVLVPMYPYSDARDQHHRGPVSPLQPAANSASLLHSPAYPSPAHSDTEPSRHFVDGLGLYQYSQPFPTSADRMMFSPSPQPHQAWNGPCSMGPAPIVNPWTSGAYDHPVCPDDRTNMLWPEYHTTHRSSTSSRRAKSAFSGDDSEHSFPSVKLEGGVEWATDNEVSLVTVAPDRLVNSSSYNGSYGSPRSVYESDSTTDATYKVEVADEFSPSMRPRSSQSDSKAMRIRRRQQQRRTKIPVEEAKFKCEICNTGFVRAYNKKTHMARHSPNRCKEHLCEQCDMKFERRTDLVRHINSVHLRLKEHECGLCGKKFARRDTLNRHRHDSQGSCPRRNEVDLPALIARSRSMQSSPGNPLSYLPSPQPEAYNGFQPADSLHGAYDPRGHQQRADGGGFDGRFLPSQNRGYGHGV